MGMKSEGDTITCDCGFSFQRGHSGKHECADGLRAKLAAAVRREEGMKAIVDVMGLRITELEQRLQQPAPTVSFYRDGIMAAAKWVDQQREAYDNEHGRHDPDTGSFEFGNSAQEEHSSTLQDIADGIRSLHPNAKNTAPAVPVLDERAAFNAWNNEDNLPIAGVPAKNAAWLAWQARAKLQLSSNSPVIPDGWKLVPVELTEKMVIHGFESEAFEALTDAVLDKKGWPYSCRESAECVTGIFKAMVEVAPSPGGPDDSHATAT